MTQTETQGVICGVQIGILGFWMAQGIWGKTKINERLKRTPYSSSSPLCCPQAGCSFAERISWLQLVTVFFSASATGTVRGMSSPKAKHSAKKCVARWQTGTTATSSHSGSQAWCSACKRSRVPRSPALTFQNPYVFLGCDQAIVQVSQMSACFSYKFSLSYTQ